MKTALMMDFEVNKVNNKINVKREFNAPVADVWSAWTEPQLLDLWWAPKPWKTETKSMDLRPGGRWLYAMVGPDGEAHWCIADYITVNPKASYSGLDAFCDIDGNINENFPRSEWHVHFSEAQGNTLVSIEIRYQTLEDLEKIIELGFKEGFMMALGNLDEIFATRSNA